MTRLAIVIVTHNSAHDIDGVLRSLSDPAPGTATEIAVVDNASTDGTPAIVRTRWPAVRLIALPENAGFSAANNRGVERTEGELVLFLNPDTVVPPAAIDRLVAALDRRPDVAIAGPRLVDADGRAELSHGRMISPWAELRQRMLVRGNDRRAWPFGGWVERLTRRTREVDWVSGACLLVRRADLTAAGGWDERFFMYAEDVDLCAAVRARGRKVLFTAESQIVHLRGRSAASAPTATRAAYRRSQLAFYAKHHPGWVPALRWFLKIRGRWPDNPA